MPAINPTNALFQREGFRTGPYTRFRDRYELAEYFLQRPGIVADFTMTTALNVAEFLAVFSANRDWQISGAGDAATADQVLSVDGGVDLVTNATDNDQVILSPRNVLTSSVPSTAWGRVTWEPQHESRFQCIIELPVITDILVHFGLSSFNAQTGAPVMNLTTEADAAKIQFSTEGSVSTTKFTAAESVAGSDTETVMNTTDVVEATRTYNLEVRYSSTGFARFYVDGVKKHTAASAHTAAAALFPFVAVQQLSSSARTLTVRQIRCSRVWQDG